MKVRCDYCGSPIEDSDMTCPNCGARNESYNPCSSDVPRTIEELKAWAVKHNLPLGEMRTYIEEDYRKPKAFGIYKDKSTGKFIVYKNKENGTRSIRYEGYDEAYAVNELYQKMKDRVVMQKSSPAYQPKPAQTRTYTSSYSENRKRSVNTENIGIFFGAVIGCIAICFLLFVLVIALMDAGSTSDSHRNTGGSRHSDNYYYDPYYDYDSYYYDPYYDPYYGYNYDYDYDYDYNYGYDYDYDYGYDWEDEDDDSGWDWDSFWDDDDDWDDDWDSDYDWDSGNDWDYDYDDWDSDW